MNAAFCIKEQSRTEKYFSKKFCKWLILLKKQKHDEQMRGCELKGCEINSLGPHWHLSWITDKTWLIDL